MGGSVRRGASLLPALVGAVVLLAGCSDGAEQPGGPFAPRPSDVDLARLDPCSSLTEQQLGARDLGAGAPGTATVNGTSARDCTWIGPTVNAGVQFIAVGAETAAEERGSRLLLVEGFGAVEGAPETNNGPGLPAFCQIAVDAGPQQSVRVQVNNGRPDTGGEPEAFRDVCRHAEDIAGAVMVNIRG
ncbi:MULTISPECIES: DUF3558 family protein [Pseudonocardia]|uniref:DUF3558 domain-containing protein n=2 Tax=Pseudonocardia TaxID=1847 RepID=A0A1Y2MS01_PSEAH|nr:MULTISPECIES: DUF3558 family protein [Pseudonocardia]OSY37994.1 hypothetical protein BG845_04401 [Pseudonocardia autotrophica]TDN74655.1 uncharacterized protein DUF3558 [Pseudonocardia autotrophica]GEC26402.1 hypothetical protein PSA01_34310 [Pseudonocardia saturnea]